jgi:hypothetical protein
MRVRKTKCPQCEANGDDHDAQVELFKKDLYAFNSYFLPFPSVRLTPDLHWPIIQWYHRKTDIEGHRFIMIMQERSSFKTTNFNVGYVPWRLARNKNEKILVMMNSSQFAADKCSSQRHIIQTDKFKHFFPDHVPDEKKVRWNNEKYDINRDFYSEDPSVIVKSTDSRLASSHCDVMVLDDLVDGMGKDVNLQMQRAMDFMALSEGLWVDKNRPFQLVLGTFWPGGFYESLIEDPLFKDSTLILGCYADNRYFNLMRYLGYSSKLKEGDPIFSTQETIDRMKKKMGPFFVNQMENKPIEEGDRIFHKFNYFEWKDDTRRAIGIDNVYFPVRTLYKQLIVDPATLGKSARNDDGAYTISAYSKGIGVAFVLKSYRGKVHPNELVDRIIKDAVLFDVDVVRIEEAAQQQLFTINLRNEIASRNSDGAGINLTIIPVTPKNQSKAVRIKALQPFNTQSHLYLNPDPNYGCVGDNSLQSEMESFKVVNGEIVGSNPNQLDSLGYHIEYWRRQPSSSRKESTEIPLELDDDDFYEHEKRKPRYYCPMRQGMSNV